MHSERVSPATPLQLGRFARFHELLRQLAERQQWEAENPELTADWNAAWLEDEQRTRILEAEVARKQFRENMPYRLERMGVPPLAVDALKANLQTAAMSHVEVFMRSDRLILLLLGGPGTGKTVAAASALIEAPAHSSVFAQAVDVARLSDYNVEHMHELERVTEAKLLVLDDLGAEHANDFWVSRLDGIINHRYGHKRRTVITSNLDAQRFKKQYGERIADRVREVGMVKSCGNQSLRKASP